MMKERYKKHQLHRDYVMIMTLIQLQCRQVKQMEYSEEGFGQSYVKSQYTNSIKLYKKGRMQDALIFSDDMVKKRPVENFNLLTQMISYSQQTRYERNASTAQR